MRGALMPLKISEAVTVGCKVKRAGDSVKVQALILGEHHAGATLYKDGRRIDLTFVVKDAAGKKIAQGTLAYG
jgi:hypothetical protein